MHVHQLILFFIFTGFILCYGGGNAPLHTGCNIPLAHYQETRDKLQDAIANTESDLHKLNYFSSSMILSPIQQDDVAQLRETLNLRLANQHNALTECENRLKAEEKL